MSSWHARISDQLLSAVCAAVPHTLSTLVAVALHDGPRGCFASLARLARMTSTCERTVRRHLAQLVDAGILATDGVRRSVASGRQTVYRLAEAYRGERTRVSPVLTPVSKSSNSEHPINNSPHAPLPGDTGQQRGESPPPPPVVVDCELEARILASYQDQYRSKRGRPALPRRTDRRAVRTLLAYATAAAGSDPTAVERWASAYLGRYLRLAGRPADCGHPLYLAPKYDAICRPDRSCAAPAVAPAPRAPEASPTTAAEALARLRQGAGATVGAAFAQIAIAAGL